MAVILDEAGAWILDEALAPIYDEAGAPAVPVLLSAGLARSTWTAGRARNT